ncbi:unnamed protein product [Acanthoscelides obtectus]|uniref:Uncharacterized protein n=1 Tax=Acanthoscelides obtectus TaxID=200917 RepID=A0A9P0Q6V4_ACAOB|nr:unnamed protein product [Acanthoscelides obtectus]CAK1679759.1 hypothetical protein AOBTE_LOCUS32429 [Acanthoscelides obtectus]
MIEGDEDINHHIKELFILQEKYPKNITNIRLLIQVSHVLKRLSPGWFAYEGTPPKHLHSIKIDTLEDTAHQLYRCVKKVYSLVHKYAKDALYPNADAVSVGSRERKRGSDGSGSSKNSRKCDTFGITTSSTVTIGSVRDKYGSFLPEQEILLESKLTMTLKKYHSLYALVPQSDIFKDKVWPVPGDFIPFAVFSSPYDMATEMPAPEAASEKQEVGSEPIEESSSEEHT